MSETTTIGSDSDAGNLNGGQTTDGADGSTSSDGDFFAALSEDNQKAVAAKGWDDPNKVLDSYRQLESKLGDNLSVPGDDADQEAWESFYSRVGRPDNPEAYELSLPEGLDENFAYDEDSAKEFRNWAHEAGLNSRQAQLLHDKFVQQINGEYVSSLEAQREAGDNAHKELVKEWGRTDSETYKRNVELANRAIRELGGSDLEDAFKRANVFRADGAVTEPAIAKAFAEIGARLFSEDKVFSAEAQATNPFAKETMNLAAQTKILRSDPELARTLGVSAGISANEMDSMIESVQNRR